MPHAGPGCESGVELRDGGVLSKRLSHRLSLLLYVMLNLEIELVHPADSRADEV